MWIAQQAFESALHARLKSCQLAGRGMDEADVAIKFPQRLLCLSSFQLTNGLLDLGPSLRTKQSEGGMLRKVLESAL